MSEDSSLANQLSFSIDENVMPENELNPRANVESEWDAFVNGEREHQQMPQLQVKPVESPVQPAPMAPKPSA